MQSATRSRKGYGNLHTGFLTPLPCLAQSRSHRVRPRCRADNTHKILRAHQTLECSEHGRQITPLHKVPQYPRCHPDAHVPRHVSPAYRIGQQAAHSLTMLRHKGQFLGLVLRLPIGFDTRLQVFPRQQNLTPQPRTLHRHTHLHRAFQPRKLPPFKRYGHAAVKQRVRTLHLYQLFQTVSHTLALLTLERCCSRGFRRRQLVLPPLVRYCFRIEHAVRLRTVLRHRHFERNLYLGGFCKGQLACRIGKQRGVGNQYALSGHEGEFPWSLHDKHLRRGCPADRSFLFRVFFLIMQAAAKQFVQVRIVHLDHIERRGDAAVTLWDDQHRGTLHLFGLDLRGLGFLAAQVKRVLFNIPDCEILILYGSYAVHEILVHRL
ncbi:hypothetical protein BACFIN_06291 [Bacteroides finegoldii DSM 17565]|nr:hypothetical protein BACFIN_06291 [Bacteroides finegoldii DSM 17565]